MSFRALSFLLQALLVAGYSVPAGHEYMAPGPGDVRSPCPGLNSIANHGFVSRSGRNISVNEVAQGLLEGLNVGLDFGLLVGEAAVASNPDPLANVFNYDQLREHNFPIEHDVSLSRQDYYQGDNLHFNQSVFNEVLNFYTGMTDATKPFAIQALVSRIHTQQNLNGDKEIYGVRQILFTLVETSLYLSVMGDPVTGVAPVAYVKSFFEEERLPYELGWTKPTLETNFPTLTVMASELFSLDPQAFLIDGENITEATIRDIYELRNPTTGLLINATCALAGAC